MIRQALFLLVIVAETWSKVQVGHAETPATTAPPQINEAAAQTTVRQALSFLAADMRVWREERKCAACHHGPMYVWAASVAEAQGYPVDAADVAETRHWLVSSDDARIFRKTVAGQQPRLSQATIYLAQALNASPRDHVDVVRGWQQLADHWTAAQHDDGSWTGQAGRPPIFNSAEIITRQMAVAMAESQQVDATRSRLAKAQRGAESWLAAMPGDNSHQGLLLRLWHQAGRGQATDSLIQSLRDQQREDGGWSQIAERGSDAFATGQSLVALHRAGVAHDNDSVERAIDYLVRTQQADGTWKVASRADPETGKPAKFLNPITYAASAWAALGISSYVPDTSAASTARIVPQKVVRPAKKPTADNCPIGECPGKSANGPTQGG